MRLIAILLSCCAVACGSTDGGTDGGIGGGGSNARFSLSAADVKFVSSIMGQRPMTGRNFLTLTATLKNTAEAQPLSTAYPLFSVVTKAGLSVLTSSYSSLLQPACAADLSVAAGGQVACGLVFEIPTGDTPTQLDYADPMMRRASVDISAPAPPAPSCNAIGNSNSACQSCAQQRCSMEASAVVNNSGCLSSLMCLQQQVKAGACDYCNPCAACPTTPACSQALGALEQCIRANCATECS